MRSTVGQRRFRCGRVRAAGLAACAVLLTSGSLVTATAASAATPTAPPPVVKTIDPAALKATVDAAAQEMMIPGVVVEVRTPQGRFTVTSGTTQRGTRVPPRSETHFRIASITKTMTAAVIVQLAQEGKLRFSDPISKYVPNVPNGRNITIDQLLKMRSGLYGYTNDPAFAATLDAKPAKAWTPREVLDIAFRHPPVFPPGTAYDYSNTNYALLGLVAEKVGGEPLGKAFRNRLFKPNHLRETTLPAATDTSIPDPFSRGYMYGGSAYALVDKPYPPDVQAAARAGTLQPHDYTNQNPSYATAAGGAISTADDLATWMRALVGGRVFDADTQRRWLDSPQATDPAQPTEPQYGWGIERQTFAPNATMYYHFGELPGFNSFSGYDPGNKVTLVIWSNLTVAPDSRPTANVLLAKVAGQIYSLPS